MTNPKTKSQWQAEAERVLKEVVKKARQTPSVALAAFGVKVPRKLVWQIGVRLVSAPEMKRLNRKYRSKNYVTDVLSFQAPPIFRQQGILGELVICLPQLKLQAKEQNIAAVDELRILLVHGVLHLAGFDHEKGERQAREMERAEKKLLPSRISRSGLIKRVWSGNS